MSTDLVVRTRLDRCRTICQLADSARILAAAVALRGSHSTNAITQGCRWSGLPSWPIQATRWSQWHQWKAGVVTAPFSEGFSRVWHEMPGVTTSVIPHLSCYVEASTVIIPVHMAVAYY